MQATSNGISAHSWMISDKRGRFCTRNSIFGAFFDLDFVSIWSRIVNEFVVGFIGRARDDHVRVVLSHISVRVVLDQRGDTSEGPGFLFVLKTSRFYLGMLVFWQL